MNLGDHICAIRYIDIDVYHIGVYGDHRNVYQTQIVP